MKSKNILFGLAMAVVLQMGMLAGSAQTNIYLFSGSLTNITLPPGTYIITAYGAPGAGPSLIYPAEGHGGSGAEMSAEFNFSTPTNLTLLVGGGGGVESDGDVSDPSGGGGGGSFVVQGTTPLVIAGGGGGPGNSKYLGGNGNVSTNGSSGTGTGGLEPGGGGTDGGGGGGGGGYNGNGGGGGGGFLGNGTDGVGVGTDGGGSGSSFETGGNGGNGGYLGDYSGGNGGYGGGGGGGYNGGGGGGIDTGGGGGGSFIDSSAIAILAEVSGILSPDGGGNGEIIVTAAPLAIITANAAFGFTNGAFGFDVTGPSGSNVVIEASTDLQTWIPLQANLLGSGPLYFSDPQWTNYPERFYRVTSAFTVGGTLTGLPAGATVTLQDNGGDNLTLSNNGTFTFPTALPNGQSYSVTGSGTGGGTLTTYTTGTITANGSGTISGTNVTNVAVRPTGPALTGDKALDMLNAAVADGTANGGVPGVMYTENGGPFRVTAPGTYSYDVCLRYQGWSTIAITVGNTSCSSTTFPSGTPVIQFGTALACGQTFGYGY